MKSKKSHQLILRPVLRDQQIRALPAIFYFLFTFLFLAPLCFANSSSNSRIEEIAASRVIVRVRETNSDSVQTNSVEMQADRVTSLAAVKKFGLANRHSLANNSFVLRLSRPLTRSELGELAQELLKDPSVLSVEPDQVFKPMMAPNDPLYRRQWHYSEVRAGIKLEDAWEISRGSQEIVVAVIDSGAAAHADLEGVLLPGYDFVSDTAVAGDGDGWDEDSTDTSGEGIWHGLHVAGTIAAKSNNGIGLTGINHRSKILPIRVLGIGGGFGADLVVAIRWAVGLPVLGVPNNPNPAHVINLSLGASGVCSPSLQNAINEVVSRGVVVVAAAGNSNSDITAGTVSPAGCGKVITVGATTRLGRRAAYSNYSTYISIETIVDLSAPGGTVSEDDDPNGVLSLGNTGTESIGVDAYTMLQGTSMASPHVAGVASLMLSINSRLTPAEIESILESTADAFLDGSDCLPKAPDKWCGYGILDANAALKTARSALRTDQVELDFGTVQTGASVTQSVSISNSDSATPITFEPATVVGADAADFTILADGCGGVSLAQGNSCQITVAFSPSALGASGAVLRVPSDALALDSIPLVASGIFNTSAVADRLNANLLSDRQCLFKEVAGTSSMRENLHQVRIFRDRVLKRTMAGRAIIRVYYALSDLFVPVVREHEEIRAGLQWFLGPVIEFIKTLNAWDEA